MSLATNELTVAPLEIADVNDELSPPKRPYLSFVVIAVLTVAAQGGKAMALITTGLTLDVGAAVNLARTLPMIALLLTPNKAVIAICATSLPMWQILVIATFRRCLADPFQYRIGTYIGGALSEPSTDPRASGWFPNTRRHISVLKESVLRPFMQALAWLMKKGGLVVVFFRPSAATMWALGATRNHKLWHIAVADILGTVGEVWLFVRFGYLLPF